MYVQSSEVSPIRSLIPVSIRRLPRSSSKRSGCRYHGNQIFHCDRADASAVRTRCCCDNHRHRHGTLTIRYLSDAVLFTLILFVLIFLFPLPDSEQKAEGKSEGLIASLKHTNFSFESIAMIVIGFTCTGTFQLWLNCAQNFAKENVRLGEPVHHADLLFRRYPDGARCHLHC